MRGPFATALIAASALSVVAAAGAHPPAPVREGSKPVRGETHRWLHQSRAPLLRGRIQVLRRACPGYPRYAGCVRTRHPRRIYLHPQTAQPRGVLYHELGHVFDLLVLNRSERREFKRIVGVRRGGWFLGSPGPSELFADAYAACSVHRRLARGLARTAYGYRATPRRHARACALMRRAAAPRGRHARRPPNVPPVIDQVPPAAPTQPPGQPPRPCSLLERLLGGC
jgi:hypothetical protein